MDLVWLVDLLVDFNLKFMKWCFVLDLDLDFIKRMKCLLFGVGIFGGYVLRNLMGWGVCKIIFVDYGKVLYLNFVCQFLFEFEDCVDGGKFKVFCVVEVFKCIYFGVESEGYLFVVFMFGYLFMDEMKIKMDFEKFEILIKEYDVIFLLMDMCELRWLLIVIGKVLGKIVMNVVFGFDLYVVMWYGVEYGEEGGVFFGCYFCNDVVVFVDVS